jgi:hypothetical protein
MEHLERDLAAEPLVTGPPDDAHAAAPQLLAEAVPVGDDVVDVLHERHLPRVSRAVWKLLLPRSEIVNALLRRS